MITKTQKSIRFNNACGCIVDETLLKSAILWYVWLICDDKPVVQVKKIFLHGKYPAISIHGTKLHVHRLLFSFYTGRFYLADDYVHHRNGNKLDNSITNLEVMKAPKH